jgi:hypothetical protein
MTSRHEIKSGMSTWSSNKPQFTEQKDLGINEKDLNRCEANRERASDSRTEMLILWMLHFLTDEADRGRRPLIEDG